MVEQLEMIKQEVNLDVAANVSYLQDYFDSFFDVSKPKNIKFSTKRKKFKCQLEHEQMVFYPSCELQRGNSIDQRNSRIIIKLDQSGLPIVLQPSRVSLLCA